tara:strand:- start:228 stop:527 length:300 start_codon:yes stop_codon:yes gene_type:complete
MTYPFFVERQGAISSLIGPNKHYVLDGDTLICGEGVTPPTESEIDAEIIKLQAEYDAQEYARDRASEYPALSDQLDEIYHNGIDSWKAVIKVTKDKYPK